MITLSKIKERAKQAEIEYSYGVFTRPTSPPHLIGNVISDNNFAADNKVHFGISEFQLQLTTIKKDLKMQEKVESEILFDTFLSKTETYIDEEEVYNTSYFFDIKEE